MNRQQHRTMEVRSVDDGGRMFTARAVTYNVVDWFDTQFAPGVFTKSLERAFPKLAWGHDWSDIIGRVVDAQDGPDGLDLRCRLSDPDAVPRALQAMAQLRDGDVTDVSVGFSTVSTEKRDGILTFTEADLEELSLVLAGAVPGAKVLALRSRAKRTQFYLPDDKATAILTAYADAMNSGVPQHEALMAALGEIKESAVDLDINPDTNADKTDPAKGEDPGEKPGETDPNEDTNPDIAKPDDTPIGTPGEIPGAEPETGDPLDVTIDPAQSAEVGNELDKLFAEADVLLDAMAG